jgi:spermidine synthase
MSTFRSVENPSPNGPHDIAWTLYNPGGAKLTRVFNNGHPVFEHWHPFEKPAPEYVPPAWTWGVTSRSGPAHQAPAAVAAG